MPSDRYTNVTISKSALLILRQYLKCFKWTPAIFFDELAYQIKQKIPNIEEITDEEIRELPLFKIGIEVYKVKLEGEAE